MSPSFAAEEMGPAPDSLEAPPSDPRSQAGPDKQGGATKVTHEQVHYTSAAERCETCEFFDEAAMHCKKNNFEAEPQGHCDSFKVIGDTGDEVPEEAEEGMGEEPMDDELGELEELG